MDGRDTDIHPLSIGSSVSDVVVSGKIEYKLRRLLQLRPHRGQCCTLVVQGNAIARSQKTSPQYIHRMHDRLLPVVPGRYKSFILDGEHS